MPARKLGEWRGLNERSTWHQHPADDGDGVWLIAAVFFIPAADKGIKHGCGCVHKPVPILQAEYFFVAGLLSDHYPMPGGEILWIK